MGSILPLYQSLAEVMLAVGLDRVLFIAIPIAEVAFAAAFSPVCCSSRRQSQRV